MGARQLTGAAVRDQGLGTLDRRSRPALSCNILTSSTNMA